MSAHKVIHTSDVPRAANVKPIDGSRRLERQSPLVRRDGVENTIVVFDARSYEVVNTISVGQRVWGLAITTDGKKLYAANSLSNNVSVINTSTDQVVKTIKAGDGPWGIAIGR